MTIQLFGLLLVFLGCAGTGMCMARGIERQCQTTEALLELVRRVGADVRCYKRPLPQIYGECKGLPPRFLQLLQNAQYEKAFALLEQDEMVCGVCLRFFEGVGRCNAEECQRLVEHCSGELTALLEQKKEAVGAKARVYRSLGLAGGLAAVILLF